MFNEDDFDAIISEDVDALRRHARRTLRRGRSLPVINQCVSELTDQAVGRSDKLHRRHDVVADIACKAGCDYCCYLNVYASPAEIIRIVGFLRKTIPLDQLDARMADIETQARAAIGMSDDDRATKRVTCPLLKNRACSVYPVRPFACRAWNSFDASACQAAVETDPKTPIQKDPVIAQLNWTAVWSLACGLVEEHGLGPQLVDLNAGVLRALERANVADEWISGKRPFDDIAVDVSGLLEKANESA